MESQSSFTGSTSSPPTREIPTGAPLEDTQDNPHPSTQTQWYHCRQIILTILTPFWMGFFILIPCLLGGIILLSICFLSIVVLTILATCAFCIAPEAMTARIAVRNATANPTTGDFNQSVDETQVDSEIQNQEEFLTWLVLKTITTSSSDGVSSSTSTTTASISLDSLTTKCCDICMMEYSIGQVIGQSCHNLECDHYFHKDCILKWLQMKPTCPCCRRHFDNTILNLQEGEQLQESPTGEQPNSSYPPLHIMESDTATASGSHVDSDIGMNVNADRDLHTSTTGPLVP